MLLFEVSGLDWDGEQARCSHFMESGLQVFTLHASTGSQYMMHTHT